MRQPWEYEGPLCAEVGSDIFFPEKEDSKNDSFYAKQICSRCAHKVECLEWALETVEEFGIWGGTSPRMRMRMRSSRKKKSA